jgi:PAS domain S-box-containing protein
VKDVLGYSADDFISGRLPYADIIPEEDIERVTREVQSNSESGAERFEHQPYRIIKKDKSTAWIADYTTILRDDSGAVTHYLGYIIDVTKKKLAEEALSEGEHFLNNLFESIRDGISVLDKDLTIRRTNGVMKKWFGDKLPLEGKKCFDCYHNRGEPCDACPALRAFNSGRTETEIFPGLPGSPVQWFEVSVFPIKDPNTGEITSVVEFTRDITQRRKAEEERLKLEERIQQARKFESLNVMAGSAAHNFNNLLMIVLGNLEIAQWGASEDSEENEYLTAAKKAAKRAADLSTLMLTYVGQNQANMQVVDMTRLIRDIGGMLKMAVSKKAFLTIRPFYKPLLFRGDPDQINQAIVNLVNNASEAIGENGGEIIISTGVRFYSQARFKEASFVENPVEGDYVFLEVSDTGCGMDEKTMQSIFDPFFTTKFTGRGLGLSAVLGIIRACKGAIFLDTNPGKGTTFTLLFPTPEVAPPEPAEEIPEETPTEEEGVLKVGGTILLVDEDENIIELQKNMLEELGYNVITSPNPRSAVEAFLENPDDIACVLIDINAPDTNVDQSIREMKRHRDVSVVIAGNFPDEHMALLFQDMPVSGFIKKPFRLDQLASALKKAIKSSRRFSY